MPWSHLHIKLSGKKHARTFSWNGGGCCYLDAVTGSMWHFTEFMWPLQCVQGIYWTVVALAKILATLQVHFDTEFTKLKGKFSSGIEGALASTFNRDFNWKQLVRNDSLYFSFDVFKVFFEWHWLRISRNINKKRLWILGVGVALYYDLKCNRKIQILKDCSLPGCLTCKYFFRICYPIRLKDHPPQVPLLNYPLTDCGSLKEYKTHKSSLLGIITKRWAGSRGQHRCSSCPNCHDIDGQEWSKQHHEDQLDAKSRWIQLYTWIRILKEQKERKQLFSC